MWYPESVPLRKAAFNNIAKELVLLLSHVGLPKNILTDQRTPFVARLLQDLCWQLQVKHIKAMNHPMA